jgi:hypothetical protein
MTGHHLQYLTAPSPLLICHLAVSWRPVEDIPQDGSHAGATDASAAGDRADRDYLLLEHEFAVDAGDP